MSTNSIAKSETNGIVKGEMNGVAKGETNGIVKTDTKSVAKGETNGISKGETKGVAKTETNGTATNGVAKTEAKGVVKTETNGVAKGEMKDIAKTETNGIATNGVAKTETKGVVKTETNGIAKGETDGIAKTETNGVPTTEANGIATTETNGVAKGEPNVSTTTETNSIAKDETNTVSKDETAVIAKTETTGVATTDPNVSTTTETNAITKDEPNNIVKGEMNVIATTETVAVATTETNAIAKGEPNDIVKGEINGIATTETNEIATSDKFIYPAFLLCPPTTYSVRVANNIWMTELKEDEAKPDYNKAMTQFNDFYRTLAARGFVYLLPCPEDVPLQDLVFTANIGIVLSHLSNRKVAIVSNFTSEPRVGETEFGVKFFKSMGYETFVPETKFEGEADLKYLYGNVYIGGYGMRSDIATYKWMEKTFDMKIICVQVTDEYLYHLDCSIFPLSPTQTVVCKELFTDDELKSLEEVTEVINVDYEMALSGACNSLRIGKTVFNSNNFKLFKEDTEDYNNEILKNDFMKKITSENGLELEFLELDEYTKSGALLSCMVLHMNRYNY